MSLDNPSLTPEALAAIRARLEQEPDQDATWVRLAYRSDLRALLAQVEALQQEKARRQWQPIETAPNETIRQPSARQLAEVLDDVAAVTAARDRIDLAENDVQRQHCLLRLSPMELGRLNRLLVDAPKLVASLKDLGAQHAQMREALPRLVADMRERIQASKAFSVTVVESVLSDWADQLESALSPRLAPGSRDET